MSLRAWRVKHPRRDFVWRARTLLRALLSDNSMVITFPFLAKKSSKVLLVALISREANISAPCCTLDVSRVLELQ
jgi:hypothetical protein